MVVLGPSPGGWRWQPWCSVEIYVLMALHRWENSFCLAAFTVVTALFFSYMNTTNCSIFSNASCDRFAFSVPASEKANATVGNALHVFQVFSFSVPAKEWDRVTISYSVKGRQNSWFVWTKTWSNRVGCSVSEMFSSPKCNPQLLHLYFFNDRLQIQQRQCQQFVLLSSSAAWRNTLVSASSWVHPLIWFRSTSMDIETTLSPQVGTSILREIGVLSLFSFGKKRKTGHSCSHRSSRSSSRWKVMVPKVTPYDVDLAPFAFCPDLQAVCEINVPNNIQPSNTSCPKM